MTRLDSARGFLEAHGRDIDRARFDHHFGDLPLEELLTVLGRYQNADGGFGRGLEVDIAAPDSNPFATEIALAVCLRAGAPGEHPLLQRTVAHLEETQDEEGNWRFSAAVYRHELAPWFQGWTWPAINPSCPIAGLLRGLGLGSARLQRRVGMLFDRLATYRDLLGDDFYAVMPYAYYFLPEWEHPQRELYLSGVLWWLIRQHEGNTIADAGHFLEYVGGPDTQIGRSLPAEVLGAQLDRLEAEQQPDGGWPSPYNERWRGPVTVQALLHLQAFGRL